MTEKKLLTPAQYKAIEALLTTGNVTQAADVAGVARNTLYRWMSETPFTVALRDAEGEAVAGLARRLAGMGNSAASVFFDAMQPNQKISVRLRAAEIVSDRLLKLRELVDFETRLAELERMAHA